MKSIAAIPAILGFSLAILVSPLQAQDETDDLYINSKDIAKRKEKAKENTVGEKTYYSYPQAGQQNTGSNTATSTQEINRFNEPGYTNKYIEAEKNEKVSSTSSSGSVISQTNNQNYNIADNQTEDIRWYRNNKRNLRRKAYGSQYSIAPSIGFNNYGGWNTSIGFGYNSGWNNGYGWNSPYYNGWNNYGYNGYGGFGGGYGFNNYGFGTGFYNPYSFGNYYYSPGWFVGYNSYSGWGSGFGGYGGYGYNPYSWGAWGNPYYGWRPAVYVPVNTYSNNYSGGSTVNYGPLNDRSSPAGRNGNNFNSFNQNNNSNVNGSSHAPVSGIEGGRGGGSYNTGNGNNGRNNGNPYGARVPSRDGYSSPQSSSPSNNSNQTTQQRGQTDNGSRNYSVPSRDRSDAGFSRPSNAWGGNQDNSNYGGRGGGGGFGGNSGGNNRTGGNSGGGGGFGGGNSGGGGGRVPGGR